MRRGLRARQTLSEPPVFPVADLYTGEPGEAEPAWVQTEREQFRDFRDLNKDGRLDGSEVGHWVLPPAQDQPLVEANHLLQESDRDKVGGERGTETGGQKLVGTEAMGKRTEDRGWEGTKIMWKRDRTQRRETGTPREGAETQREGIDWCGRDLGFVVSERRLTSSPASL